MILTNNKTTLNKIYIALLIDGLCVSSANVILPLLREQFNLQYSFTGLLLAFLSIGNLASALLCGILAPKLGMKKTTLLFICGMFLGYGFLLATGLTTFTGINGILLLGFLLIGLAKGASMNNGVVLAGNLSQDKTKSVNMINAMFALGCMISPFLYQLASNKSFPWWMPLGFLAIAGIILWLIFFSIKNYENNQKKDNNTFSDNTWTFLKEKHFWISTALLFGQQCAEISVTGWLVTYYKDQGLLTGALSEYTVTIIWFAMLTARLFIVFFLPADKSRNSLVYMSIASIITYILMLCASSGITAIISLFLFGLSIAGVYPTAIAQASKGLSNSSVGIQLPIAGIGAIIMPYITGAVAQSVGIKGGMACSIAALVFMLIFAVLFQKNR